MALHRIKQTPNWWFLLLPALGIGLVALVLTWVSGVCTDCQIGTIVLTGTSVTGAAFLSFLALVLLAALLLYACWWSLGKSETTNGAPGLPRWLAALLVGAALLRLTMGMVWYLALPQFGHGTDQEQDGYVMADAHERDQFAQKIARNAAESHTSLWKAFQESRRADTYGGLLFISAVIYRYLGTEQPSPLSMVVITAAVSALAVIITWGFARRTWNARVADFAAWGVALYPEAVLLGSSQMREAFLIPLVVASFYGLTLLRPAITDAPGGNFTRAGLNPGQARYIGLIWLLSALLLTLLISPTFTIMLVFALALATWSIRRELFNPPPPGDHPLRQPRESESVHRSWSRWILPVLISVIVLGLLIGGWLALRRLAPAEISNPVDVVSYWLRKTADLQAYYSKDASGWVQKIFRNTPEWTHLPILIGYGVLRPFLPAALTVSSVAPIWPWITLWRAIGWTILLGLLLYALLRAWINKDTDPFTRALTLIAWLVILIASLRGGGDQDDNPRYRATFVSIQIALAAWGWVEQRRTHDPVFRRAFVTVSSIFIWAILWYVRRIYPGAEFFAGASVAAVYSTAIGWVISDPFKIIATGVACGVLYSIWDWLRSLERV